MGNSYFDNLTEQTKNFVFMGEAGSGKTETAINLALLLAARPGRPVHFFDMDQTKPLFRAREAAEAMEAAGVTVHYGEQFMDAPTVAPGVIEALMDEGKVVLLDVGGGAYGSHMIGQFSHILSREGNRVFYLVNPYRPWSGSGENVAETMRRTLGAARISGKAELVANPNLGPGTTAEEVLIGLARVRELFPETKISFVAALKTLSAKLEGLIAEPVLGIKLNTLPEWLAGSGAEDITRN